MQLPHNKQGENNDKEGSNNIMSGQGYPGASAGASMQEPNFSEFMWMADEDLDEFDRKVMQECDERLQINSETTLGEEEEEFLQRMLEEEEERDTVYFAPYADAGNRYDSVRDLSNRMRGMNMSNQIAVQSNLNPHAAEFIPGQSVMGSGGVGAAASIVAEHTLSTAIHHHNHSQSAEGNLYSHNCANNSIQGVPPNSASPCLQTQNIVFTQNNTHQRFNNPIRAQMNGHNAIRRYYSNTSTPVYLSNVPVFPVMNYVQVPQAPQHPQNRYHNADSDRNEDEGYGDN